MPFVTVPEASQLTGRSISTILRFVRRNKNDNSIIRSELVTGHWQYRVNTDILRVKFGMKDHEIGEKQAETGQENDPNASNNLSPTGSNEMLGKLLDTLQKQLEEKDKQLQAKDETIKALISNNHQLSGVIAQLQLPAPKKKEEHTETGEILSEKEETGKKHASSLTKEGGQNKKTGNASEKKEKKKSLLARIFTSKLF